MKGLLAVLLLAAAPAAAAGTYCPRELEKRVQPCTAHPDEQFEIMGHIRSFVQAHGEYEKAAGKEATLRDRLKRLERDWHGSESWRQTAKGWQEAVDRMGDAKSRMESNAKSAIEKTQAYYGIRRGAGVIRNGPLNGKTAKWAPRFQYAPKREDGQRELVVVKSDLTLGGKPYYVPVYFKEDERGVTAATTTDDNGVFLGLEAFKDAMEEEGPGRMGNPGKLASTLYHERAHFELRTMKGRSMTKEQSEAYAYGKELEHSAVFQLDGEDLVSLEEDAGHWRREYDRTRKPVGHPEAKKPTPLYPVTPDDLRQQQDAMGGLFRIEEERINDIREGQNRLKARVEVRGAVMRLQSAASSACDKPGTAGGREVAVFVDSYRQAVRNGPAAGLSLPGSALEGLSGCARAVLSGMLRPLAGTGGRLSAAEYNALAREKVAYYRTNASLWVEMAVSALKDLGTRACAHPGSLRPEDAKAFERRTRRWTNTVPPSGSIRDRRTKAWPDVPGR